MEERSLPLPPGAKSRPAAAGRDAGRLERQVNPKLNRERGRKEPGLFQGIFAGEYGEGPLIMVTVGLGILITLFLVIFGHMWVNYYTGYKPPERKVQYVPVTDFDWVKRDNSILNSPSGKRGG